MHQIVQAPGYVAILTEMMHEARVIPLDGRPRLGAGVSRPIAAILEGAGRVRRWWSKPRTSTTRSCSEARRGQLRLVERFTRIDADTIEYRLTVTDPATFSRPWTIENGLRKADGDLYEVGCHEGNYGMRGILAGARAEESRR